MNTITNHGLNVSSFSPVETNPSINGFTGHLATQIEAIKAPVVDKKPTTSFQVVTLLPPVSLFNSADDVSDAIDALQELLMQSSETSVRKLMHEIEKKQEELKGKQQAQAKEIKNQEIESDKKIDAMRLQQKLNTAAQIVGKVALVASVFCFPLFCVTVAFYAIDKICETCGVKTPGEVIFQAVGALVKGVMYVATQTFMKEVLNRGFFGLGDFLEKHSETIETVLTVAVTAALMMIIFKGAVSSIAARSGGFGVGLTKAFANSTELLPRALNTTIRFMTGNKAKITSMIMSSTTTIASSASSIEVAYIEKVLNDLIVRLKQLDAEENLLKTVLDDLMKTLKERLADQSENSKAAAQKLKSSAATYSVIMA